MTEVLITSITQACAATAALERRHSQVFRYAVVAGPLTAQHRIEPIYHPIAYAGL